MTPQMRDTLDYLRSYYAANRIMPSYGEIAAYLDLASRTSAYRRVDGLVSLGLVRRIPGRARGLALVEKACPHCGGEL